MTRSESDSIRTSTLVGNIYAFLDELLPAWMSKALCAQTDPEAFYPEKGGSTREAKQVCSRCPVSAECLDAALEREERFGIWGGMSERERRRLLKQQKQKTDPNPEGTAA